MTIEVEAYQTLEDRDNIDEVELSGPYPCTRKGAWLGYGYYFWDTNIDWAHHWGNSSYSGNYFIGKCSIDIANKCFDLFGSVNCQNEFSETVNVMLESNKIKDISTVLVANVIEFLKKHHIFDYNSIRCADEHSFKKYYYKNNSKEYMRINQRVQICVINKKDVILQTFKVIYPEY